MEVAFADAPNPNAAFETQQKQSFRTTVDQHKKHNATSASRPQKGRLGKSVHCPTGERRLEQTPHSLRLFERISCFVFGLMQPGFAMSFSL
ncbi:MAG: hypothetical protein AAGF28_06505 [Pseudomonadota bacterium]